MSEIEKMYENAGVEKREQGYCDWDSDCPYDMDRDCGKTCPYWVEEEPDYPPFTAEKQLRLTTFIGLHYGFQMLKNESFDYIIATRIYVKYDYEYKGYGYGYDEAIANLINNLWQDLTESEQEQIKRILE